MSCIANTRFFECSFRFTQQSDYMLSDYVILMYMCVLFFSSSKLRLVDVAEFQQKIESMELALFQNLVMRHIDSAKERLLKK